MKIWLIAAVAVALVLCGASYLGADEQIAGGEGGPVMGGDMPGPPPRIGPRMMRRFQKMDADGNGQVSRVEWTAYYSEKFDALDKDGDGAVTPGEMRGHHKGRKGKRRRGGRGCWD